jgi:hypothetical protein
MNEASSSGSRLSEESGRNGWARLAVSLLAMGVATIGGTLLLAFNGSQAEAPYSGGRAVAVLALGGVWIASFTWIAASASPWPSALRLTLAALTTVAGCVAIWVIYHRGIAMNRDWSRAGKDLNARPPGDKLIETAQLLVITTPLATLLMTFSLSRRIFAYAVGTCLFWWLVTLAAARNLYR